MILVPYRFGSHHHHTARKILKIRHMNESLANDLPEITFIVFDTEAEIEPIAMGALRFVEGGYGMLDGFITDPTYSSDERNEALDLILKALMREAMKLKMKKVFAYTAEESLILRAYHEGFGYNPSKLIVWEAKET